MGGRGAYWSGHSADFDKREFDEIRKVGNIKVLKARDNVENVHFPLYSNTKNTTYFIVDPNNDNVIKTVCFYRNHALVESIDITSIGIHAHYWVNTEITRRGITTKSRYKIKREIPIDDTRIRNKRILKMINA